MQKFCLYLNLQFSELFDVFWEPLGPEHSAESPGQMSIRKGMILDSNIMVLGSSCSRHPLLSPSKALPGDRLAQDGKSSMLSIWKIGMRFTNDLPRNKNINKGRVQIKKKSREFPIYFIFYFVKECIKGCFLILLFCVLSEVQITLKYPTILWKIFNRVELILKIWFIFYFVKECLKGCFLILLFCVLSEVQITHKYPTILWKIFNMNTLVPLFPWFQMSWIASINNTNLTLGCWKKS